NGDAAHDLRKTLARRRRGQPELAGIVLAPAIHVSLPVDAAGEIPPHREPRDAAVDAAERVAADGWPRTHRRRVGPVVVYRPRRIRAVADLPVEVVAPTLDVTVGQDRAGIERAARDLRDARERHASPARAARTRRGRGRVRETIDGPEP